MLSSFKVSHREKPALGLGDLRPNIATSHNGRGDLAIRSRNFGWTYRVELKNVTRDNFGGFNFLEFTITQNGSLESKGFLQFVDNGPSPVFLGEADNGVEQQQGADDTEIDPILQAGGKEGSKL